MKMKKRAFTGVALALVVSLVSWFSTGCASTPVANPQDGPIHFVQITDTHFGKPVHDYRFRQAVEMINALPFDVSVVAHTGDFASDNLYNEQTGIAISNMLALVNKPVISAPGNHDLSMKSKDPDGRLKECLVNYLKYIGPLGQVHETDEAVFIAVCTEALRRDMHGILNFDALAWLSEQLEKAGNKPVFVFTHVPEGADFYGNSLHEGWPEDAHRAWRNVLKKGNVKAVIAGHYHRDELQQNDDGIPTFVGNAIADFWGRQASFRIYTYKNGRISFRTVYIEDPPAGRFINRDGTLAPEEPSAQVEAPVTEVTPNAGETRE